jgi:hypothetical protein
MSPNDSFNKFLAITTATDRDRELERRFSHEEYECADVQKRQVDLELYVALLISTTEQ